MQQSTVVNLRLANRICQVLIYSHLPKEDSDSGAELSDKQSLKEFRMLAASAT